MADLAELLWTSVDSSNVHAVGYHEDTETLAVQFNNGGLYTYQGVDTDTYCSLIGAASVGQYMQHIKTMYPYSKYESMDELLHSI